LRQRYDYVSWWEESRRRVKRSDLTSGGSREFSPVDEKLEGARDEEGPEKLAQREAIRRHLIVPGRRKGRRCSLKLRIKLGEVAKEQISTQLIYPVGREKGGRGKRSIDAIFDYIHAV